MFTLLLCILYMRHAEEQPNTPVQLSRQAMADTVVLLRCRQALASNLRRQIQALREQDGSDKSAMPSYGTVVRYFRALPAGSSMRTMPCIVAYLVRSFQQHHSHLSCKGELCKSRVCTGCTGIRCCVLIAQQHAGQVLHSCYGLCRTTDCCLACLMTAVSPCRAFCHVLQAQTTSFVRA